MRMRAGATLSGLGHAALIALVVMGLPWFSRRDSEPVQVTEVSFVSEADFRRAQAAAQAPRVDTAPPVQPAARPAPPKPAPTPTPTAPPAPEPEPEAATLAPDFNPDAPLSGPATAPALPAPTLAEPAPPAAVAPLAAVAPPLARPAPTIAPAPTPPPPVTARPADEATPEPAPAPKSEPPREPRPQTAPPEAAPEPAAPEVQPDLALATQAPPKARPAQKPAAQPADAQPDKPTPQEAAVLQALKQEVSRRQDAATPPTPATPPSVTPATPAAGADSDVPETSLPSGPPITNAEKDGLRLAVQRCWVVPAGLRDASELRVTLAAELTPDGAVVASSIKLIDPSPAPDPRFQQAYEAGRRALLRCAPYADLPRDKFAQWRNIEVVFDPKGMVSW